MHAKVKSRVGESQTHGGFLSRDSDSLCYIYKQGSYIDISRTSCTKEHIIFLGWTLY